MQFWEIARLLQAEEKRQARLRGENVLYQGYRRYLRVEFHPSLRRRRAMMERGAALGVAGLSGSALVSPDGSVAGEGLE